MNSAVDDVLIPMKTEAKIDAGSNTTNCGYYQLIQMASYLFSNTK